MRPWNEDASAWTDSDDRVRGGKSQSHLQCDDSSHAEFHGHLDISALGGAGFASQRTTGVLALDLSGFDGLLLDLAGGDGKKYTLTLKDEVLPRRDDGREQSSISWEFDFTCPRQGGEVVIEWTDFKPTYRGKPKEDAKPLDRGDIKRLSIMMRRYGLAPTTCPGS